MMGEQLLLFPKFPPPVKPVGLTEKPNCKETDIDESFVIYRCWGNQDAERFYAYYKIYFAFWSALRYGVGNWQNTRQYIKNMGTNEIVWRSWEDENPYRV